MDLSHKIKIHKIKIGFILKTHGAKGKLLLALTKKLNDLPHRIFIKNNGDFEEFKIKLKKEYKRGFIIKLNKIKGKEDAEKLVLKDVFISLLDYSRKERMDFVEEKVEEVDIKNPIEVGVIRRPHGLGGEITASVKKEFLDKIKGKIFVEGYKKFIPYEVRRVRKVREGKDFFYAIIKLDLVKTRDEAEILRKRKIFIEGE